MVLAKTLSIFPKQNLPEKFTRENEAINKLFEVVFRCS